MSYRRLHIRNLELQTCTERDDMATLSIDAKQFEKLREETGLDTLATLADALGIDKGTASRVISGKSAPGPTFISAVLTRFPVKFEDVFTITDNKERSLQAKAA